MCWRAELRPLLPTDLRPPVVHYKSGVGTADDCPGGISGSIVERIPHGGDVKRALAAALVAGAAMTAVPAAGSAQQPQQNFLPVGSMAPDVSFTGATRYGLLAEPVRLSQFRGQTVVIAFFFRARTPG